MTIIKAMLFVQIVAWGIVAVVGLLYDATQLTIFGLIFAVVFALYTYCVWDRIEFAGVCLSIASKISQTYSGVVWLSFASIAMATIWYFIWAMCAWAYVISSDGSTNQIVIFILLVS